METEIKNNEFRNFIEKFLLSVVNNTISEESEYKIQLNDKDKLFYEKINSLIDDINSLSEDSWMNLLRYSSQENNFFTSRIIN